MRNSNGYSEYITKDNYEGIISDYKKNNPTFKASAGRVHDYAVERTTPGAVVSVTPRGRIAASQTNPGEVAFAQLMAVGSLRVVGVSEPALVTRGSHSPGNSHCRGSQAQRLQSSDWKRLAKSSNVCRVFASDLAPKFA